MTRLRTRLDDLATRQFVSPYTLAIARMSLNEKDRAQELLERGVAARDPNCLWMNIDPDWDSLRSEPRFQALLKKVGFPE